jgi:GTP-binding protein
VEELRAAIVEAFAGSPPRPHRQAAPLRHSLPPLDRGTGIAVERRDWGLEVAGKRVERLLERYDLDTPAGFDRFQVALDRMGVSAALEEAGAEPGVTVRIGDAEFEYQP